jgi:DNA-binding XRE family transcriptional regulator
MLIADLRTELGLSQADFAARIGLASKGNVSIIERENRCGLNVALAIEALSGGRIDAAEICEDVKRARDAVHAVTNTAAADAPSSGKNDTLTAAQRSAA